MRTSQFQNNPRYDDFQEKMLNGVSRTFSFTIAQLPEELKPIVSNTYLLCRIIDTIEDEPTINPNQKKFYCHRFLQLMSNDNQEDCESFSNELSQLLSNSTIPAEHELVKQTALVLEIMFTFPKDIQKILYKHISTMVDGMLYFQQLNPHAGLDTFKELSHYCYYVAGVIGELLTDLFCDYAKDIEKQHHKMTELSNAFGQGLQLTNILKDVWDDHRQGICWLPRDVFKRCGFELDDLEIGQESESFNAAMKQLTSIAYGQLLKALEYTLCIPVHHTGIRKFCFWSIGMAVLTLQKIYENPSFSDGSQVKISRNNVKMVVIFSSLNIKRNKMLKVFFKFISRGLNPIPSSLFKERRIDVYVEV